jgi:hypothetical protein
VRRRRTHRDRALHDLTFTAISLLNMLETLLGRILCPDLPSRTMESAKTGVLVGQD